MVAVVRETERKYDATGGTLPEFHGLDGVASVSPPTRNVLNATYYDTAGLHLIRAGVTLRRRTGGGDAGWHLKLPAGTDARDELRLPLGRAGGAVPDELASLVRAVSRGEPLAPVVRMRTVRRRRQLLDATGRPLAEIAADQVSARMAGESVTASWAEIEVELMAGDRRLLRALDARLGAAGVRRAAEGSKLARVLRDRLGAAGQAAPPPGPAAAAGDVVLAYLTAQVRAITVHDPLVRRDEPDAVHQMRVAARRARSALQAFGKLVSPERAGPLRAELKWLGVVLARARAAEVLLARFDVGLADAGAGYETGPARARITAHFTGELAEGREALLRELDGQRYLSLLRELDAFTADPPLTRRAGRRAARVLPGQVRRASRRLDRAIAAIHTADGGADRDAAIHEARKAAKRARYAAEAAAPALGRPAARLASRTKRLQELLGEHHDSVVARQVLVGIAAAARAAGADTFAYGVLYQREACLAAQIERAIPEYAAQRAWR